MRCGRVVVGWRRSRLGRTTSILGITRWRLAGLGAIGATVTGKPRLACAHDDPTCSPSADQVYPGVFDVDLIPRGGHLDMAAGYGEWPSIVDWCEHADRRLTAND